MENESQTDAGATNQSVPASGSRLPPPPEPYDTELSYYDMSKDKILLVFNHEEFKKPSFWTDALPSRRGSKEDKDSLKRVFTYLKFKVAVYKDLLCDQIFNVIDDFVKRDHSNTSCVVMAILTHGADNGELFAADGPYNVSQVMAKFEASSLLQIPKMFLVQACRGKKSDAGQYVQLDGGKKAMFKIPTHGDFLVLYSTIEGYVSYRQPTGSWMIQTFCEALREYHDSLDILHIITIVNNRIAHDYVSRSLDPAINDKKQMSEARYTLTKILKF